jgi:hypothetical protein
VLAKPTGIWLAGSFQELLQQLPAIQYYRVLNIIDLKL